MDIFGTPGHDTLYGTPEDDVIEGLDGADIIDGGLGNDIIRGGAQRDTLYGGPGDDLIEGGDGATGGDIIYDGAGNDMVTTGSNNDFLINDSGNDILRSGAGADYIRVQRLSGPATHVIVDGGDGGDSIEIRMYGAHSLDLDAGAGSDRILLYMLQGQAELTLGAGADIVTLSALYNGFRDGASIRITDFDAGPGGDRLILLDFMALTFTNWNQDLSPFATGHARLIQSGADTLLQFDRDGGGDYLTVITFVGVSQSSFTADALDGYPGDGSIPAGMSVDGTVGADVLVGRAGHDRINGSGGDDSIRGAAGDDELIGGDGVDQLYGEIGDDRLWGGQGLDVLDGGHGDDTVLGEGGDDYLSSLFGADMVDGGAGNDNLYLERGRWAEDIVTARGGAHDDFISVWSIGASTFDLDGGTGSDTIYIGALGGTANIALGDGADIIQLSGRYSDTFFLLYLGSLVVSDFEAGAGGDRIDLDEFLVIVLANWDGSANPFGTGHVRLVQSGADTLLQVDADAAGSVNAFRTIVTLEGAALAEFAADNFTGHSPDGSAAPGQTITGTWFDDELQGSRGGDYIEGLPGSDRIHAGDGPDIVIGDYGDDRLYGEGGTDWLEGGEGMDRLDGGPGADVLYGGAGDDYLFDGAGSDQLFGGDGADSIEIFRIDDQPDLITIDGGGGDDSIYLWSKGQSFLVDGGDGNDHIFIERLIGDLRIRMGTGADTLSLVETIPRTLFGAVTIEDFATGASGDWLDLSGFLAPALAGWDKVANPFATGDARLVQDGGDTLFMVDRDGGGDSFELVVRFLGVGASTFTSENLGYPVPAVYGTSSGDLYTVDDMGDVIVELAGGGIDEVRTALGTRTAIYVLPDNVENLTGTSASAQAVAGNALDNVIAMGAGNDLVLLDGGGVDSADGGAGNDFFYYGDALTAADVTNGGAGTDTIGLLGNYALTFGASSLTGVERLALYTGGGTNDYVITMNDANVAGGAELLVTAASLDSNESLIFNGSAETNGRFAVLGGDGGDTIVGGSSSDYFAGNDGDDALYGLGGTDFLIGGLGADRLRGGSGADHFRYQDVGQSTSGSVDHILDFQHVDRIDLSAIDANGNAADGNQAFAFIGNAAFGNVAGQLRATNVGNVWTVEGDTNGDGAADLVIQVTVPDATPIVTGDFVL